jgi:hypothetical protein
MQPSFHSAAPWLALASALLTTPALARRNGIATAGCDGCHGSANASTSMLSASPAEFLPGEQVTFTLTVRGAGSEAAGVFVPAPLAGTLSTIAGEGLTLSTAGLTHSAPKAMQNGEASFRFAWKAPAEHGAVDFLIYSLGANGDQRSSGDQPGRARFDFVYGCSPQTFYYDSDGDGYGGDRLEPALGCAGEPPVGYAEVADDCDESIATIHPGAEELCNQKDDDCDGEVDEDSTPVELWPDPDGDGYHDGTGVSVLGCVPLEGYAADAGDCAMSDADRSPGQAEVCNLFDDNCDGRVDERVRPQCGEGWCRRDSINCDPSGCTPGAPVVERCNLLDDDCDAEVDEGELCAAGEACLSGSCVPLEGAGGGGGGSTPATGGVTQGGSSGAGPSAGRAGADPRGGSTGLGGAPPSSAGGPASAGGLTGGTTATPGPPASNATKPRDPSGCASARGDASSAAPLVGVLTSFWLLRRRARARLLQRERRR